LLECVPQRHRDNPLELTRVPLTFIALRGKAPFAGSMSGPTKYILVSLPTSISTTNDKEEALTALQSTVASENVTVLSFKIPEFKIGTLDALVQQADDLAKLESSCEAVVAKVGDSLRSLLEGDEEKISQQKTVNDSELNGSCIYMYIST
jgi:hypothetical protein